MVDGNNYQGGFMVRVNKSSCVRSDSGLALRLWFSSCLVVLMVTQASGQPNDAVVKVVSTIAGKSYEGIGFVYQPPNAQKTYVVTALHVVAGSSKIEIQSAEDQKLADARIFKFYRKADLVLLEPKTPLGITPLPILSGAIPSGGQIWSISQQVDAHDMQLGKEKPLFDLFRRDKSKKITPEEVKKYFDPHNYPDHTGQVLELAKSIGPGDSGSPITYDGAVISMVDGGLQNLGIKKAWWSIPLKKNLDLLLSQGETDAGKIRPYAGEGNRILFSKPRGENQPVKYKKGDPATTSFSLYHTDRVSFGDVYETMLPEDREFIKEVIDDDAQLSVDKLSPEDVDVYECYKTGATFAIPTMLSDDLEIDQDGGHTFVEAFSQFSENSESYVKLIIFIDGGGLQAKDSFKQYILSGEALNDDDWGGEDLHNVQWVKDEESDDDVVNDLKNPNEPYYHEIMERTYTRANQDGEVYSSMTINQNGVFLGVAIIVNDPSSLTGDDLINYYLMEACMTMAGFPYE